MDTRPRLEVERVSIAELVQDPENARGHSRRNIDEIKESLQRFGQVLPVVVRGQQLVGGNATQIAAFELGWQDLDIVRVDHLSIEEARRLAIMLNRSGELAHWNRDVLVDTLRGFEADLTGTGFTSDELEELERYQRPEPAPSTEPMLGGLEYRIIVQCGSEVEQAELLADFASRGLDCKAVIV